MSCASAVTVASSGAAGQLHHPRVMAAWAGQLDRHVLTRQAPVVSVSRSVGGIQSRGEAPARRSVDRPAIAGILAFDGSRWRAVSSAVMCAKCARLHREPLRVPSMERTNERSSHRAGSTPASSPFGTDQRWSAAGGFVNLTPSGRRRRTDRRVALGGRFRRDLSDQVATTPLLGRRGGLPERTQGSVG